jgi:hypothetical protein
MERLLTVEFGPSRSKRFGKALAEAESGAGECSELEPGRYRVRFVLGREAGPYTSLARLLARVRPWRASEVCERDELVSTYLAGDIRVSGCPTCLGQPCVGAPEFVGWWEPSGVKGGRQSLVRVSGESRSISRQIRAPAASTSAPWVTQTELIARGQRSWTASWPVSLIRPRSRPRGRWASR